MSLIKWTPMSMWDPFEEMDQMMAWPGNRAKAFVPSIDVYQDNDNVYVETALAGVDPAKVDVNIENDVLTIKGSSERQSEVDDKNYYRKEVHRGSFYRSVALPTRVLGDEAKAEFKDGILKITAPKAAEVKPKSIKVEVK